MANITADNMAEAFAKVEAFTKQHDPLDAPVAETFSIDREAERWLAARLVEGGAPVEFVAGAALGTMVALQARREADNDN